MQTEIQGNGTMPLIDELPVRVHELFLRLKGSTSIAKINAFNEAGGVVSFHIFPAKWSNSYLFSSAIFKALGPTDRAHIILDEFKTIVRVLQPKTILN